MTRQPVSGDRFNVFATLGDEPRVVLSTHYDCVPPFYESRVEGGVLIGRGVCDAKGILAAQVAAAERLRQRGETRVGLLFVVGEERGSDGARVANERAPAGRALPDQRRADRQPARHRDARDPARAARGVGPRGAFVVSRAGCSRPSTSCSTR